MFDKIIPQLCLLLLLSICLPISKLFAQISTSDSLSALLEENPELKRESELIDLLVREIGKSDRDSALRMLEGFQVKVEDQSVGIDEKLLGTTLSKLADDYFLLRELDKAKSLQTRIYEIAQQIQEPKLVLSASLALGRSFTLLGEHDSSEHYLLEALKIGKEEANRDYLVPIYDVLGGNAGRAQQYDQAIAYYEESLALNRQAKDSARMSHSYLQIAATHYFQGNFPKALDNGLKCYEILELVEVPARKRIVLDMLSSIYETLRDDQNNLKFLQLEEEAWSRAQVPKKKAMLPLIRGKLAFYKKKYRESISLLQESLTFLERGPDVRKFSPSWYLGRAYLELERADSALFHFTRANEFGQPTVTPIESIESLMGIGISLRMLGRQEEAIATLKKAHLIASDAGMIHQEMLLADELYLVSKQENPAEALQYLEQSVLLKDSIFNEKKLREITRLEANFEFEKEKQELLFQRKQEAQRQRAIRGALIGVLIALIVLFVVGLGYYRSKQVANRKLNHLNHEIRQQKEIVDAQNLKLSQLDELKSHFFTNISHEFRTPLTIISGMIDQVRTQPDLWLERGAEMIKQNSRDLLNLVNQILELRKLETKELRANYVQGDIILYLEYLSKSFESLAKKQQIELHFLSSLPSLVMDYDPEKLLQIISNLLSNAIKFTAQNERSEKDIYLLIDQKNDGNNPSLTIRVKDTGAGIPPEELPQIFERFYRVKSSIAYKGYGIGLSLSRELAALLGGRIEAQSEFGKGSTFNLSLPINNKSQQIAPDVKSVLPAVSFAQESLISGVGSPHEPQALTNDSSSPLLLIVEDNPDFQEYLMANLQEDYQLIMAFDGQEGIEIAIEKVPDLIVSDVMMPKKDGYQLCETLKLDERTSHIPIILLTAKVDTDSRIEGLKKGADAYLAKPFEPKELLVRLEKLSELRRNLYSRFSSFDPNNFQLEDTSINLENEFMSRVYKVILEHMEDADFGTVGLAHKLRMSRAQLHNKVKALTGKPTSHLIRKIRLQKAKHILENTSLNVSEIAYQVGFKNHTYFSRVFHEEFQATPSQIRERSP